MKTQAHSFSSPSWVFAALLCVLSAALAASIPSAAAEPAPASALADNAIESVDYSSAPDGKLIIKVGLKQPLQAPPAGFVVNNPPRIALDFPNTANKLGKSTVSADEGVLRSVNIVQAGNRTRMVINLSRPAAYDTRLEGRNLLLTLQSPEGVQTTTNVTTRFAEAAPSAQQHSVRDVDFRRGAHNEGRIIADLSDTAVGIDIRKRGKDLVVDIGNTSLPRNLERKLDVTDFGTPVQFVDTARNGDNVRMVITPKGNWEYSAYQTDRQFIVEVKAADDTGKPALGEGKGYTGDKLSLNFQNVEVRAVLQVIADFTGLNIVTSDSVGGSLTLRLKDVPWDQALAIILQSKGLDMRRSGNVIWIAPRDELATKEKLALESKQQISELEPVQTERFQMKYQKAADVQKILSDPNQKILSKRGSVVVDARTNSLFVQDTPSKLEDIRRLVDQIDIPVKQVLIDARIVEARDDFSKNIGARLGVHDMTSRPDPNSGQSNLRVNVSGTQDITGYWTGQYGTPIPKYPQTYSVNLPASGIGGFNPGSIALSIFHANSSRFLNLELSALEADGGGKVISNPRVVTADQVEATIEQGTEVPYQQATSSGATSVSFKKATLSLKVKPQITPDDNIIMDLKVNKDSVGTNTTAGPSIDTKQVATQVLVENGGTVVIGGIYTQDKRDTTTKVPVLGDIPVVGFLFKNRTSWDNKTELLIFVTPKIVRDGFNIQ
jgi:type IV pilus assembly protein PilQ